jgi:RNase P subunit RPR2
MDLPPVVCRKCEREFIPTLVVRSLMEHVQTEEEKKEPIVVRCPYCKTLNRIPATEH